MGNWKDIKVVINGQEVEGIKSIQYTQEELKKTNIQLNQNFTTEFNSDLIFEFYYRRKNKYFFKSNLGLKHVLINDDNIKLKKGQKYILQ